MNKLVIPPSPNWFSSNILACAFDNTAIYGSRNEIVVINPTVPEAPVDIQVLGGFHSARVVSVAVNKNWGNPNKWAVSVGEDNVVQLLDISTYTPKISHVGHKTHSDKVVGAQFAGEDRVISVSEKGFIIIWKLSTNQLTSLSVLKDINIEVSAMSICPHVSWLMGIGTRKGVILVTDLKKSGRILYRIRAHDDKILSLSWCPTPYNVFPKKTITYKNANSNINVQDTEVSPDGSLPDIVPQQECVTSESQADEVEVQSNTEQRIGKTEEKTETGGGGDRSDTSTETLIGDEVKSNVEINLTNIVCEEHKVETVEENQVDAENTNTAAEVNSEEDVDVNEISDLDERHCDKAQTEKTHNVETVGENQVDAENTNTTAEVHSEEVVVNEISDLDERHCDKAQTEKTHKAETVGENQVDAENTNTSAEMHSEEVVDNNEISGFDECHCDKTQAEKTHKVETVGENQVEAENTNSTARVPSEEAVDNNEISGVDEHHCDKTQSEKTQVNDGVDENSSENHEANGIHEDVHDNENRDKEAETSQDVARPEYLLASTSRGSRSIKIWRAGTDGRLETEFVFPKMYCQRERGKSNTDRSWITTCWVTPRSLLSSTSKSQLLEWRIGTNRKANESHLKPRLIHSDHTKQMFCIAAPVRKHESIDDEDWRDKNLLNAWTLGSDRFILNTSLGCDHKMLSCFATFGGAITCLSASPIDPTRIALGVGDSLPRILDLSRPHLQTLSMTPLCDRNNFRVTNFAWHPKKESCLAYGTQEGHVGLIDTTCTSRNISEFVPAGHGPLYHIQWGPSTNDLDHLMLYLISSGQLVAYDTKNSLNAPTQININNGVGLTSFAWKHDYSILAVATKNCELLLYDNQLKLLATFLLQSKTVRCIEWHPPGTPEENWLALSTNQVIVYDCNLSNLEAHIKYEEHAIAVFSEHQGCVHAISWSPHQSELLASAGDMGMAMVWNVKTKTLLHACVSNQDVLYNVVWSPLDSDYLITAGRGSILRIWKLSENPPDFKIDKAQQKRILTLEKSKTDEVPAVKAEAKPKRTAKCLLNGISQVHNLNVHSDMLEDCIKLFNSIHSKDYKDTNMNSKETNNERSTVFDVLDLFDGKDGIDEILKLERENHSNRSTPLCMESISLWQGDIGDTIKNAIKCGSLNHWLVSVAPMVSFNLWQEACEAYAKQLLNESCNLPVEAAYYFLACHKVEEAIEALCAGSYYREAIILAKSRLSPADPLIDDIIKKFAAYSTTIGKYEIAAQCYIVLNMLEDAAKVLFRRSDIPILEFCVKLAEETGNEELLSATQFRLNAFKAAASSPPTDSAELQLKSRAELEIEKSKAKDLPDYANNGEVSVGEQSLDAEVVN